VERWQLVTGRGELVLSAGHLGEADRSLALRQQSRLGHAPEHRVVAQLHVVLRRLPAERIALVGRVVHAADVLGLALLKVHVADGANRHRGGVHGHTLAVAASDEEAVDGAHVPVVDHRRVRLHLDEARVPEGTKKCALLEGHHEIFLFFYHTEGKMISV